jgi:hypothetical protein
LNIQYAGKSYVITRVLLKPSLINFHTLLKIVKKNWKLRIKKWVINFFEREIFIKKTQKVIEEF